MKVSRGVDVPPPHQPSPALRPFDKLRAHKFGGSARLLRLPLKGGVTVVSIGGWLCLRGPRPCCLSGQAQCDRRSCRMVIASCIRSLSDAACD